MLLCRWFIVVYYVIERRKAVHQETLKDEKYKLISERVQEYFISQIKHHY